MIQRLLSLFAVLATVFGAFSAKTTVYFQEFDNSAGVKDAWLEMVRGAVLEGFYNTNRTNLIDAVTESSRYEEALRELQATDKDDSDVGNSKGANVIINGDVTAFNVTGKQLSTGSMSYDAKVTFILRIVNPIDGTILGTKSFTLPKEVVPGISISNITKFNKTEEDAVQAVKGDISKAMKNFVDDSFPVTGPLEEIESLSRNKKEVETFYAGIGSDDGILKGHKLDVKIVQKIGSKSATKVIGEAEITEVAGDDISLCKVKKGGEEIMAAREQGKTIIVSTKTRRK